MSSPIQSGDDEYEFQPELEATDEPSTGGSIHAYIAFVAVFVSLCGVVFYVLWRTGRCHSRCDDEETGGASGGSGKSSLQDLDHVKVRDSTQSLTPASIVKANDNAASCFSDDSTHATKKQRNPKLEELLRAQSLANESTTTAKTQFGIPRRSSFDDLAALNASLIEDER